MNKNEVCEMLYKLEIPFVYSQDYHFLYIIMTVKILLKQMVNYIIV